LIGFERARNDSPLFVVRRRPLRRTGELFVLQVVDIWSSEHRPGARGSVLWKGVRLGQESCFWNRAGTKRKKNKSTVEETIIPRLRTAAWPSGQEFVNNDNHYRGYREIPVRYPYFVLRSKRPALFADTSRFGQVVVWTAERNRRD